MNINWNIIQPCAATNYVLNPSFEEWVSTDFTSWTQINSPTISQNSVYTWRGAYSAKIIKAGGSAGIYQDIALVNGNSYNLSVYVYIESGSASMSGEDYGGAGNYVTAISIGTGWQRLTVTKVAASGGIRLWLKVSSGTAYFDAVQLEDGTSATTYIDGDEPGCYWNGIQHASTSTRDGQSREGGLPVALTTYLSKVVDSLGAGTPPFNNVSLPFGLVGGEIYQRTVKKARTMTLVGDVAGTGLGNYHAKRRALMDLLKFDAVTPTQPFKLQYSITGSPTVELKAVYDSGLEMGSAPGAYERVSIRVIAHDPLWYSEQEQCQVLGYSQSVANANYILQRKQGVWSAMGTGVSGAGNVNAIIGMPNGSIIAGGGFTGMSSVANTAYIASWNGTAWSALGTGMNQAVWSMVVDAAGNLYAAGGFTLAGGVANTVYIAKWNGNTWSALGTGANAPVYSLALDSNGNLYAAGMFTQMGGVANTAYVAKWTGAAWSALGTGADATVHTVICDSSNNVFIGGEFTHANSVACSRIAKWNGTTFVPLSSGINASYPDVMILGPDKRLYVGGFFTTAGGITCNNIAVWNGVMWSALGSGLNQQVFALGFDANGVLYAGGFFTTAGGITVPDSVALWTGSTWLPIDVDEPGTPANNYSLYFDQRNNLYLGFNGSGTATSATVTTSINASTKTYPRIMLTGPGTLYQLVNYTTGRSIYFNLTLLTGETAVLNLTPGNITFTSSFRGNIINTILQGSNLDWYLQPGSNNVSCYLIGGSTSPKMLWRNAYWSLDGVQ